MPEERKLAAAVIYNRLKAGDTLGIDATIRYDLRNYDEQLTESELAEPDDPYNTRVIPGPAADADRQPGPRLARGGREPGEVRRLLLRRQARNLRRARLRRDRGGVRPGRGRLSGRRCRSRAARRPTAERAPRIHGDAPARRARPPGLAFALAGDANGGPGRARARSASGPTRRSRSPPSTSRRSSRSLPDDDFDGVNVTVPHKLAALALADEASDAAREIGAANTLSFERRRRVRADNTDAAGITGAHRRLRSMACKALVLGAGGSARAAIWALTNAGAEVSIWNRTRRKGRRLSPRNSKWRPRDERRETRDRTEPLRPTRQRNHPGVRASKLAPTDVRRPKAAAVRCRCPERKPNRRGPRLRDLRDGARFQSHGSAAHA